MSATYDETCDRPSRSSCPVVGIGASAGGLHALQTFFSHLPPAAHAMAYVVVVHLDPNYQSELAHILAAQTSMPVVQVGESIPLQPGRVYVIAPNKRLQIADNEISSAEFDEPRGQRAPIDQFFRSLAEKRGDGFAIILTGAGSDGALGAKAVKEAGGVILVQDPGEAEYPSMPRSAIATGVADFVLPVREIADQIEPLWRSKAHLSEGELTIEDEGKLRGLLGDLRRRTGHDFSKYKRSTVLRRVARRMQVHQLDRFEDYLELFQHSTDEAQALLSDLLISVTRFFRDRKAFQALSRMVIPALFEGKSEDEAVRIWVPGCATGEEAYSLAILLAEEAERRGARPHMQVFASDLDPGALAAAREGRFPQTIEADLSEDRLRRFFVREEDCYRVKGELRDSVLFASHSLLKDPPFSRLDLISCRNLLIYMDRELQEQVCATLAYALVPGRFLFLGSSESADRPPGLFHIFDREARIYRSSATRDRMALHNLMITPAVHGPSDVRPFHRSPQYLAPLLHAQVLERAAPPSALVNGAFGVVHLSETAGRYLQPSRGPLTTDITELVRTELRLPLRSALHRALTQQQGSLSPPIAVRFNGVARQVHLQVRSLMSDTMGSTALVMFIEGDEIVPGEEGVSGSTKTSDSIIQQLHEELHSTRARLKMSLEEHENAGEELRSANEELQSINEEYRSTAEELETSREELQSVNEELQTVNYELKQKLESVSRAHNDLQNLISATDVGTLFLDARLNIKRFTPRISGVFNITSADEGRPVTDFTHRLYYDGLVEDAKRVLSEQGSLDREIESDSGQWYLMRLRPYVAEQDKIEGVVITLVDITARKKAEEDLRGSETRLQLAREAGSLGLIDFRPFEKQLWWDEHARHLWGLKAEATSDIDAFWNGIHPDDLAEIRQAMTAVLKSRREEHFEREFRLRVGPGSTDRWVRMTGKAFVDSSGHRQPGVRLVCMVQDITSRKNWEINLKLLMGELSHRVKNTLGIVQGIAHQTLDDSGASEESLLVFGGRLQALAGTYDLLFAGDRLGADFGDLIRHQIGLLMIDVAHRISLDGPEVTLSPQSASSAGLMVHELATNAVKYGALSTPDGTVSLTWSTIPQDGRLILKLRWEETGGPPVVKPKQMGFGSYLIENGLPDAVVECEFQPSGFTCEIEAPLLGTSSDEHALKR